MTDLELNQQVLCARGWDVEPLSFRDELLAYKLPKSLVLYQAHTPAQIEGVLVVQTGKRVQCEPSVASKILLLGRRNDEREEVLIRQDGAHGVNPRPSVGPHRGEKAQPYAMLV
jgi:hypothetical protein